MLPSSISQSESSRLNKGTPGPSSKSMSFDSKYGRVIVGGLAPLKLGSAIVCSCTKIGKRPNQEDRCVILPAIGGREDLVFMGVFDGTVGDHASEFVHKNIIDNTLVNSHYSEFLKQPSTPSDDNVLYYVDAAIKVGYSKTDTDLLKFAAENHYNYAASTSVTVLVSGNILSCAHLGDSRVVIGTEGPKGLEGKPLTKDHKPDVPLERMRIEKNGGKVMYLQSNKPFIRGGDFQERQAMGDRPMQLNYSRAFGGKDLKKYGLSAEPDIIHLRLSPADRIVILASDGLWDVVSGTDAVIYAMECFNRGIDPALALTDYALEKHNSFNSTDNVTVICYILNKPEEKK